MKKFVILCLLLMCLPLYADAFQTAERNRQIRLARESGFADYEIDLLHKQIGQKTVSLYSFGSIPSLEEMNQVSVEQRYDTPVDDRIVAGKDNEFIRFKIRQGLSFSTDVYPQENVYASHCYIFQKPSQEFPQKIIFQSYRVFHNGTEYVRELRRIIHTPLRPETGSHSEEETIPVEEPPETGAQKADLIGKGASNAELTIEYYTMPVAQQPVTWLYKDGVAKPDIEAEPKIRLKLQSDERQIPYSRQLSIMRTYKNMLRQMDHHLAEEVARENLERKLMIDRMIDFTGNDY